MDFRTLQYFNTVANELNFTRAAEKLNMSQPPLSNAIQNLEKELGVQLFIRGKRHLQLTEAGSLLLHRSNQILTLANKTRHDLSTIENNLSGNISLGMVEGRAPFIASDWIAGFREEYPMVHFQMWNGSSDDVLEHLQRGLSDLAVIAVPFDDEHFDSIAVGEEPWIAIIPRNHVLATEGSDTVTLSRLADFPLIVPRRASRIAAIRKWFASIGREPNIICEMSNYLDAVALAESGVGISIFPQTTYSVNHEVVSKVIVEPAKIVEYALVWPRGQQLSNLTEEFINYVRDTIEASGQEPQHYASLSEEAFRIPNGADIL